MVIGDDYMSKINGLINNEMLLCLVLFMPCVTQLLKIFIGIKIVEIFILLYVLVFLAAMLTNRFIELRNAKSLFCFLVVDLSLWTYSFIQNIDNNTLILPKMFIHHFCFAIPIFLIAFSVNRFKYLSKLTYRFAYFFSIVFAFLYTIYGKISIEPGYDMTLGYLLVFNSMVLFSERLSLKSFFLAAFTFFLALKFGSRGLIGVFLVFLLLRFYFSDAKSRILLLVLCFCSLFSLYVSYIMGFLSNSRTISLLTSKNTMLYVSGRDRIFSKLEPYLFSSPVLGNGIGFDRLTTNDYGLYAHNIFIESIFQIGLLLSLFLFTFIFLWLFKAKELLKVYRFPLLMVILSMSTYLLYSDSFWTDRNFWLLCGLMRSYFVNHGELHTEVG